MTVKDMQKLLQGMAEHAPLGGEVGSVTAQALVDTASAEWITEDGRDAVRLPNGNTLTVVYGREEGDEQ